MKRFLFLMCLIELILTVPGVSIAEEEKGAGSVQLEEVVVTATRTEKRIGDVAASATVISREKIEASPFEKIEDILRATPGLDVNFHYGDHGRGGNRPVNLRGTGGSGDRTLILVDGVPQNNANNGWVEWSQTPKEAIERIEIVRGPASALYGSNAMGGVINIITRKPEKPLETSIEQRYGSMDTWSTRFAVAGKKERFRSLLTAGYGESDGYVASEPRESYDIKRFRDEEWIFGKLIYDVNDNSAITLGFSRYHHEMGRGREFFYGYTDNNRAWLDWSWAGKQVAWKTLFYVNDDEWDFYFDAQPNYDDLYRNEVYPMLGRGGSMQASIALWEQNTLTLGVDYKHSKLDREDEYYTVTREGGTKGKQHFASPFLNAEIKLFDEALIFNFGGRYDWIKAYDGENWDTNPDPVPAYANDFSAKEWDQFTPKLGVVYHLSNTTLRGSIGKGFKAPSLFELYTSLTRGPVEVECNPELKPEKILSYDLGIEQWFSDNLIAKLTLYQSHAKDFIGYDTISSTYWMRDNISKVRMQGVEVELDWRITDELACNASYTYNNSEIREYTAKPEVKDNFLPYTPHHTYRLGFAYTNPSLVNLSVYLSHYERTYTDNENTSELDSYSTVDLNLSKQFANHVKFSLGVENLFDEDYVVSQFAGQDTIAPGRVITASLGVQF